MNAPTYRDRIIEAMTMLGEEPNTCVIGYNTTPPGGRGGGSFSGFPLDRTFEMPLAENLMTGASLGMALEGWIPICFHERMDFTLCALDSIRNHIDLLGELSGGQHKPGVIIRVVVGNSKTPLFTGRTHSSDYTDALRIMLDMRAVKLLHSWQIMPEYRRALERARAGVPTMLIELKDNYNLP